MRGRESISGPEVYGLLKNPVRREILALLYTRGEMSATQLKLLLNVSYGTLYYHLDFLKPLLSQVRRGRYVLNERGLLVAERMLREMEEGESIPPPSVIRLLSTAPLMERVAASPSPYLALGVPVAAGYLALLYLMPVKPVLLHLSFQPGGGLLEPALNLALVLGYILLTGELLSPHSGGFGGLIASTLISYIPVDIFLGVFMLMRFLGASFKHLIPVLQAGFIAVHVVQLVMLASALTHSRGIRWERSLPAVLLLSYISLLAAHYGLI